MAWLAQFIATWVIRAATSVMIVLPVLFFSLAEMFLRHILSPNFINVSYTTNDFVNLGWTLTRDFANIFFIIILVIIGLATALKIREYQWQKTLPLLIGIALLINFTPVILGLIIDASNIVMNFFIEGIAKGAFFSARWSVHWDSIAKITAEMDVLNAGAWFGLLITPIIYAIFNLMGGIIYFLFAFLFILRYVALWTLVILSPIAFLCYILPRTRGVFELWWNQFLQWCIIGVAAAFIIYLGDHLLSFIMAGGFVLESEYEGWGLANQIVPYFVILGFLLFGFFGALTTSAMGATAVITAAQKGVKTAGAWTTKKGAKFTGEAIKGLPGVSRAEAGIRRGLERVPGVSRLVGGKGAFDREYGRRMEEARKSVEKIPDNREGNRVLRRIALGRGPITRRDREERASALEILAKRGALDLTDKEAQKLLPEFQRFGGDIKPIRIARPDLAPYFTTIDPATKKPRPMTIESAMNRIKPRDFAQENVQREALQNMDVVYHFLLDRAKVKAMAERGSDINKRQIIETIKNKGPAFQVPTQYQTQLNDVLKEMIDDPRWPV